MNALIENQFLIFGLQLSYTTGIKIVILYDDGVVEPFGKWSRVKYI
jgi:hypothetical protein